MIVAPTFLTSVVAAVAAAGTTSAAAAANAAARTPHRLENVTNIINTPTVC
jgi:hypothetical protein